MSEKQQTNPAGPTAPIFKTMLARFGDTTSFVSAACFAIRCIFLYPFAYLAYRMVDAIAGKETTISVTLAWTVALTLPVALIDRFKLSRKLKEQSLELTRLRAKNEQLTAHAMQLMMHLPKEKP